MAREKTPALTPILWTIGAIVSGISLAFAVLGGIKDCSGDAMCSMGSAIQMMFSITGVFVGALIVVGGFALRSAERKKTEALGQRAEMIARLVALEKEKKAASGE